MNYRIISALLMVLVSLSAIACEDLPAELSQSSNVIPAPTNLTGRIGSQLITLSWESDPTFDYSEFVIYRSDNDQVEYNEHARVTGPPFEDNNLRAGVVYWYRVAGVNAGGVSGAPSAAVPVTAAIYEVLIDSGATVTSSPDVTLSFTAPSQTQNVRVSEDASMTGVQWRNFTATLPFTLSGGNGTKTVYAEFIDATGNPTHVVSASITLSSAAAVDAAADEKHTSAGSIDSSDIRR